MVRCYNMRNFKKPVVPVLFDAAGGILNDLCKRSVYAVCVVFYIRAQCVAQKACRKEAGSCLYQYLNN